MKGKGQSKRRGNGLKTLRRHMLVYVSNLLGSLYKRMCFPNI